MSKIDEILLKIEEFTIFVTIIFTIFAIGFNVAMRYLFNFPLSWPDELGRYLFLFVVFIGYVAAIRSSSEIKVDIIYRLFPGAKKFFCALGNISSILFSVLLIVLGFKYMLMKYRLEEKSIILELPVWILSLVFLVVCGFLVGFRYLFRMNKELKE